MAADPGPSDVSILLVRGPRFRGNADSTPSEPDDAAFRGLRADLLVVTGDLTDSGLPVEFRRATEWLSRLAETAGVPRRHVAIVPGAHDVNRDLCAMHFFQQRGLGKDPVPPYFPKWQPYKDAFDDFYADVPEVTFTPDEPWTLFEMPDLDVVVAGLNSTMAMSHQPDDDHGLLTNAQIAWFTGRLARYRGWTQVAAVHHGDARDAAALDRILIAPGLGSLRLDGQRATAAGYELIPVSRGAFSPPPWTTPGISARRDAYSAGRDIYINERHEPSEDRSETFLGRVAEAARLRFPTATISERTLGKLSYLRVSVQHENGPVEVHPVGVTDGPASREALDAFVANVHSQFAAADPGVRSELVYAGPAAPDELVRKARQLGVRLRSFIDYQGLLDLRPLAKRQREALTADRVYPADTYVDQRYTIASGYGRPTPEVQSGLLAQATDWLSAEPSRLVVVLGDFGRGKTSFLKQLTRRLPEDLPDLTPILVELRYLEKGPTLDDLLAQHLLRQGVEDVSEKKLQYMIRSGRVALLFDGFDELELRVGYDSAADYLQTLLNSVTGQAKVVLTSRTQHFRSTSQVHVAVRTALGERVETRAGSRVAILEDFTTDQILEFLTKLYGGDSGRARRRFDLIRHIAGLLELSRNPRMLAFVAQLTDERLLAVEAGDHQLTAAALYAEIIDYWLANEEQRQRHSQGLAALTQDERFQVCTSLALRMWRANEPKISLRDLTSEVVATLTRLAERGFSDDQAAHSIASGSLLVRTGDDAFTFVHQSVMEWLVAAHAARELKESGAATSLHSREMSRLMAAFFTDLAGHEAAREWASRILADHAVPEAARQNALAVSARLPEPTAPERHDLSGLDLRTADLSGRDLRGAILRGAILRGMRLDHVNLEGADLTEADLTGVVMTGGSLRAATLTKSRWQNAALLGTEIAEVPGQLASAAIAGRDRAEAEIDTFLSGAFCVAFSPDGALLAYGSGKAVKVADVATRRTLRVLRGHQGLVYCVAFSPDGTLIATSSGDRTARVWDSATGQLLATLTGHGDLVRRVAFSPDGTLIATASYDHTAQVWNSDTGQHVTTFSGHDNGVRGVAFSPDGTLIATASRDHTARVWNTASGQPALTLTGHKAAVSAVAFSPDGTLIATASGDSTARVWNTATGLHSATLTGHEAAVSAVAFSPDGTLIATASRDHTARTWNTITGQHVTTFTGHGDLVRDVAFSPDGTVIATASRDHTALVWNAATGQYAAALLTGHDDLVRAVAFSPDGTLIATASRDHTARIWNAAAGQPIAALTGHDDWVNSVAFSPDGTLIATASEDGTARTWATATGQPVATFTGHSDPVYSVAFSPDGTLIATASGDHTARTWDTSTGQLIATLTGHSDTVSSVAFSPDGTLIATASDDRTARTWNTATGQPVATLTGHDRYLSGVVFSPDGTLIATVSGDHTTQIWNADDMLNRRTPPARRRLRRRTIPSGTKSVTLWGHADEVNAVAFDPAGDRVLTASDDGTVRIWRLSDGTTEHVLTGHNSPVTDISLRLDGRFLASASDDGTTRIWDMATLQTVATLIALPEGGYATLLPDGSYKIEGDPGDRLWWAMKLCRFGPGELDPYVPEIRRLPAEAPILPA
jgi:WD40 repeat protein/3',5'-cyclic AMP phosphodiesterase CpdA